jgi:DsbC/DsbD-like thiol-disulfide interchange protein
MHWRATGRVLSWLSLAVFPAVASAAEVPGASGPFISQRTGDAPPLSVPEPSSTNRLTAGALIWPDRARPGQPVTLFLKVRLAPGFHIYALDHSGGSTLPTKITAPLPDALQPQGAWQSTPPKTLEDGSRALKGDILFQRRLRVSPKARPGTNEVGAELEFQICNAAACWPPEKLNLKTQLEVLSSTR